MTLSIMTALAVAVAVLVTLSGAVPTVSAQAPPPATKPVNPAVVPQARPFELSRVRLLDGPFKDAQDRAAAYLLELDPDRLLAGFRAEAGLEPRKPRYDGWEARGVAGHTLGHHLSGVSLMYAATGDARFRERADYIVGELAACQAANGDGYLAAIPEGKRIFAEVARGDLRSKGFDLNGGWVPWYTVHKVMAGLRDAHHHTGNATALEVLKRKADWALRVTDNLTDEQLQTMLLCEHGGMNEVAADLYAITGDPRYEVLAKRFNDRRVMDPLAAGQDRLAGLHANTQIPKMIGAARQYELHGDDRFRQIASAFWQLVTRDHSYAIGGNSDHEHFGPPRRLAARLSRNTTETCNTYNMLKLSRHLFAWTADPRVADYYERALYNHILASQDPQSARVTYYVSLKPNTPKEYQGLFDAFTCCVGTGQENHAKYGEGIYYHDVDDLYVNLFIASELDWAERGLTVRQETRFPDEETTRLVVRHASAGRAPVPAAIHVRHPSWATSGMTVTVNGQAQAATSTPGSYVTVRREWNDGDAIEVRLPMALRLEPMPDNDRMVAVCYGPVVLGGALGAGEERLELAPVLVTDDRPLDEWLKPVTGKPLTFTTVGVGRPVDVELIPFFRLHHQNATVYWDLFTDEQWARRQAEYRAEQDRQRRLEARTIDHLATGEMQPERDHDLDGERTRTGPHEDRKWRDAYDGGWFSFTMKVVPGEPADLVCTYWGSDAGGRAFDVLVDGHKLATQVLNNDRPGKLWDATYPIPATLTEGKDRVTVRFQAHPGKIAGGLFGCRTVRTE